jgi:Polyketide cyclase / dehydrase and lipid transport
MEPTTWTDQFSIEIPTSSQVIWQIFADVPNWKRWNSGIEEIEIEGPFEAGTEFMMRPPGAAKLRMRLVEVVPNERFVDETAIEDLVIQVSHSLEQAPNGTRVTFRVQATGPGCDEVGPAVSADFPEVLRSLSAYIEARK